MALRASFHFGINDYKDGIASLSWTLQPDGRYYSYEDGFGIEDNEEINFIAYIDKSANIIIPFQQMDDAIRVQYHEQAIEISKDPENVPYICLSTETTIPPSENPRIERLRELLFRVIYGMMVQFGSQIENAYKHNEYDGNLGILRSINPTPDKYISLTLMRKKSESNNEKYDFTIVVGIFKKGQEPHGAGIMMGEYSPSEIVDGMMNDENAEIIYNELIQTVKELSI